MAHESAARPAFDWRRYFKRLGIVVAAAAAVALAGIVLSKLDGYGGIDKLFLRVSGLIAIAGSVWASRGGKVPNAPAKAK